MYEHKGQPVISRRKFLMRLSGNIVWVLVLIMISLLIGTIGFRLTNDNDWIDCFHNACMLLGGMGPVIEMRSDPAKLFSSFFSIFSGIVFITNIGVLLAPVMHRVFHRLHLEEPK
ncbi:hypothetical protein KJS94_13685 [Flavihumibacter rivuli]|uniref:hypothetical protein n=1 Tax=Flavihumibacter rivuli TaxID=2838156 RepID=UPI001BDF52EC|nr:hypothetical protein [Flavihumibacter rivuli]ULQ55696.1 hypothetical protein KJS94_13685 [Flavihumibacter rivuli]